MRCRAAVEHQGAEQHVDQHRIGQELAENRLGGEFLPLQIQFVVLFDALRQTAETVDLIRKLLRDFAFQQAEIIVETQHFSRKNDFRSDLRGEVEIVPSQPELPQQFAQRAGFRARRREIRDRMQADVMIPAAQPIERIQPADGGMPFEQADALFVIGESNAGRESGESGTDNDGVVFHGETNVEKKLVIFTTQKIKNPKHEIRNK